MFISLRTLKLFWEYATDTKIQYCTFLNSCTLLFVNAYMQKVHQILLCYEYIFFHQPQALYVKI